MKTHTASFNLPGVCWMLFWAVTFNTSMSLTKLLNDHISTFMIVFIRLCFGFLFISPLLFREGFKSLKTKNFSLHFLRMIFACSSMACTYYAYTHLPLSFATSIGFTAPIMTSILSMFALGDRLTWIQWLLIILGYTGVVIMVHPTNGVWDQSIFVALAANFFASCAMISVKKLTKTETTTQIILYFNLLSVMVFGILALFCWTPLSDKDIFILALIGATATISQFCMVKAMQNGDPSVLAPFEYSRLIIAIPIGMVFFHEIPTVWSLFGSFVIIMSNLLMTLSQSTRKPLSLKNYKIS